VGLVIEVLGSPGTGVQRAINIVQGWRKGPAERCCNQVEFVVSLWSKPPPDELKVAHLGEGNVATERMPVDWNKVM